MPLCTCQLQFFFFMFLNVLLSIPTGNATLNNCSIRQQPLITFDKFSAGSTVVTQRDQKSSKIRRNTRTEYVSLAKSNPLDYHD